MEPTNILDWAAKTQQLAITGATHRTRAKKKPSLVSEGGLGVVGRDGLEPPTFSV